MRRRTTTKQLNSAITNGLLQITKVECHYKSSSHIDEISNEAFKESLDFLCESGVFADFVDWHYERSLSEKDVYIFSSGAMNPNAENVVIAHLSVCDGVKCGDLEKMLVVEETEE